MRRASSQLCRALLCGGSALLSMAPLASRGDDAMGVRALQAQIDTLRRDYDEKIRELTDRVRSAEDRARETEARAESSPKLLPAVEAPEPGRSRSANAFNPAISMILMGSYGRFSGKGGRREIPGFLTGEATGFPREGLSLDESELDISANIDDQFYGFFDAAIDQADGSASIDIEEAYLRTLALPAGLSLKAGQFFSAIGYHNALHAHTWAFLEPPLVYEALLDTQFGDPGVQLTWVAPTDALYLELGSEVFSGQAFPATGRGNEGLGAASFFAKLGGDVGASHSWTAGVSYLLSNPRARETDDLSGVARFRGDSNLLIAHLVWKWAPNGNYRRRNLQLQAELLQRREAGSLQVSGPAGGVTRGRYSGTQYGFYAQAVYQFMPRWRVGLRYGQLDSNNSVRLAVPTQLGHDRQTPRRVSAMIDFSNSEFSRLRLQFSRDRARRSRNAVFLQYIMSIGSHGAHQF
ncbi:MAG: outer membrane beta-barrel protein [Myxococcota bacterium]